MKRSLPVVLGLLILMAVILLFLAQDGAVSSSGLGPKDGQDLAATDLDRVTVGSLAPDFSLRALSGEVVTLSDSRGEANVVLVFYRGHW